MFARSLLLVCLLLGVWNVEVDAGGPRYLHGGRFGGFFSSKMIDAFANTSGLPFPWAEVPYEMKTRIDKAASELNDCFMQHANDSKASGESDEDAVLQSILACTTSKNYDVLTLFWNLYVKHENMGTDKVVECYVEMMEYTLPTPLFFLLDAKRLCQTVQYLPVPYCTMKEMCGASKQLDLVYGIFYATFQFKANGFFLPDGEGDCPIHSSDFGRSFNSKIFTNKFDLLKDEIFARDVCDQYRQPHAFPVANETQKLITGVYAIDF
ncbi:hypothetical protein M3Y99_01936900 [Aphelenchoides fujianensis]|nr:hypothetical protein M3Y99_01936900 [Aphelenchoides fujianensis]